MEIRRSNELYHFGIKGQKWGVRRYQNANGSLTPAGLKRYATSPGDTAVTGKAKKAMRSAEKELNSKGNKAGKKITILQKQIDSFDGLENGVYDKNGRTLLSKEDVSESVSYLKTQQHKYEKQVNAMINDYSKKYDLYYEPASGNVRLAPKK